MQHEVGRQPVRRNRSLGTMVFPFIMCLLPWILRFGRPPWQAASDQAFISFGFEMTPMIGALALGLTTYALRGPSKVAETVSILLIYFGTQSGMTVYMKNVLSKVVVDAEEGLRGIPIAFMLTAIQQFVAFALFCCFMLAGRLFGSGYRVKKLASKRDYIAVLCFSATFALNTGLNNFGLSLLSISVQMLIRSCTPVSTAVSQVAMGSFLGLGKKSSLAPMEWLLMLLGVGCTGLATYAKSACSQSHEESKALALGVVVSVTSIFSAALNFVLAGVLGSEMKLNPVDTTCYMSLPAGIFLLVPALLVSHPLGSWHGYPSMTDWEVLGEVVSRNPYALFPVLFSGCLAFMYNILQYTLVHKLSAVYAAFAGNFNKAATVTISLVSGMEALPSGQWGYLFLAGIVGNITCFTSFSSLKVKNK